VISKYISDQFPVIDKAHSLSRLKLQRLLQALLVLRRRRRRGKLPPYQQTQLQLHHTFYNDNILATSATLSPPAESVSSLTSAESAKQLDTHQATSILATRSGLLATQCVEKKAHKRAIGEESLGRLGSEQSLEKIFHNPK
jgi:hypothetical protein